MTEALIQRAGVLIGQGRHKEAAKELREALAVDPTDAESLSLLAVCIGEEKKYEEANRLILQAIGLQPDNAYYHFIYAKILLDQDKIEKAGSKVREAISIHPYEAEFFGLLANVHLLQKDWSEALDNANKGLAIDAEHMVCLNCRTAALVKLNKKEDAWQTIDKALGKNPEDAVTHANYGWGLLEKQNHKEALTHFRQALQLNPELEWAKSGLVESLKARYIVYRWFLQYAFWISKFKGRQQWMIIIGLYVGVKILQSIAAKQPGLEPFLTPIVGLYVLFALSTWVIAPLSNLFLRLNVYGRYALSREEIRSSNFVGLALGIGVLGGLAYLFTFSNPFLALAIYGTTMMIPCSAMLNTDQPGRQKWLVAYTVFLAVVGAGALWIAFTGEALWNTLTTIYVLGIFIFQFVANALGK